MAALAGAAVLLRIVLELLRLTIALQRLTLIHKNLPSGGDLLTINRLISWHLYR
jgi:hypothetical protein